MVLADAFVTVMLTHENAVCVQYLRVYYSIIYGYKRGFVSAAELETAVPTVFMVWPRAWLNPTEAIPVLKILTCLTHL